MTREALWNQMIDILKTDVKPATGCTEPIALAYTAAVAASYLSEPVERIESAVSANLMKNGMGVMVPGTGKHGLYIAAAIGALDGDASGGLQVLHDVHADKVALAVKMVDDGLVTVSVREVPNILFAETTLYGKEHSVCVRIADAHTNIIYVSKDDTIITDVPPAVAGDDGGRLAFFQNLSLRQIHEFALDIPLERITFMKDAAVLNDRLSDMGLAEPFGAGMGRALAGKIQAGLVGDDLLNRMLIHTVSAADARMGGAALPAMTNSGSGNQGICATEPVCVVARHVGADEETLIRALALSHMTAIYVHGFLPKLSALCCAFTAAMGAAAAMAWLLTKDYDTMARSLQSMTGDAIGMVCDGAANSCALKAGTACSSAFRAVLLAMEGRQVTGTEGLVANDVDETIRNIGKLATKGMQETDREILDIMLHKNKS